MHYNFNIKYTNCKLRPILGYWKKLRYINSYDYKIRAKVNIDNYLYSI